MKATELRIGNYIMDRFGVIIQVTIHVLHSIYTWTANEKLLPTGIPLTEEWLLKSDAKKNKRFSNEFTVCDDRFLFIWKESYKYWYVVTADKKEYLTKIEFVHEYQNFIYVLTGEELILKS